MSDEIRERAERIIAQLEVPPIPLAHTILCKRLLLEMLTERDNLRSLLDICWEHAEPSLRDSDCKAAIEDALTQTRG